MDQVSPTVARPSSSAEAEPEAQTPQERRSFAADAAMSAYVGYLAGLFDIGQLAAGRRLARTRGQAPGPSDA